MITLVIQYMYMYFIVSPYQSRLYDVYMYLRLCLSRFEQYVDDKYKEFHRTKGDAEALASVDVMGALDMYAEQGEWEKCINTAEQQVTTRTMYLHVYINFIYIFVNNMQTVLSSFK